MVETFHSYMQPLPGREIDPEALKVNGITESDLKGFPPATEVFSRFRTHLDQFGYRGSKQGRYIPGGFNLGFDLDFMSDWHQAMTGGPYAFWDHLQFQPIDPYPVIVAMWRAGLLPIINCQLKTVCAHFGIELQAHDALSDIRATRELAYKVFEPIFTQYAGQPWGLMGPEKEVTREVSQC